MNKDTSTNAPKGTTMYTEQQKQEFEAIARQMMEWMNANCHPHCTVVITPTSAEFLESSIAFTTTEYVRD